MRAFLHRSVLRAALLLVGLLIAFASRAQISSTIDVLRVGGCGGIISAARPLRHEALLDRAAQAWAGGLALSQAVQQSGYPAQSMSAVHLSGPDEAALRALRRSRCAAVADPALRDIGLFQRGADSWLVLAAPYVAPPAAQAPAQASRVLQLVNAARTRGTRCGQRTFAPAPPVTLSATLADVARGHAADMADHNYFEHEDRTGRSPADRVRATGYREKLVGENIAYGPTSAEEVVRGWLESPGHCENIMDPRFSEMGLAYAQGRVQKHGLYWVQLFAAPRA